MRSRGWRSLWGSGWLRAAVASIVVTAMTTMAACGSRVSDVRIRNAAGVAPIEMVSGQAGAGAPGQGAGGAAPAAGAPAPPGQVPASSPGAGQSGAAAPPPRPAAPGPGADPRAPAPGGSAPVPPAPAKGPATGSPVAVGVIATLSGPVGTVVGDTVRGLQVWERYVNARGGVNGHPVKVIVGDDGGDPARFNSLAQQMVERNHVIAFLFTTLGLAPGGNNAYLDSKRVVTFGTEGGLDVAYRDPLVPTAVATGHAYAQSSIVAFAQAAVPAGRTRLAVLACSDFAACDNFDEEWSSAATQQATGFQVVYRARPSITQPDYTSQCLAAQQAGATAVIVGLDTASVERLADSCARQGYRPMYGLPDMLALSSLPQNPNVDGTLVTTRIAPFVDRSIPGVKAVYDAYAQFAPGLVPSGASMTGWTYGMFFAAAAAHLPANPTAQDVYDGLNQIRDDNLGGLTYPLSFTAGQPSARKVCWGLIVVRDRAYTPAPGPSLKCK